MGLTVQRRHVIVGMCALSALICYADRVNLSVCILHMAKDYGWDVTDQGWILSSFFYGYITTQVIGGVAARWLGGKLVLNVAVGWWSFFTFITPWAARQGFWTLICARVLMGMGEGMAFPTYYELFSNWVPNSERARSFSMISMGAPIGTMSALLLAPILVKYWSWASVFYLFGTCGFIWNAAWSVLGGNGPTGHDKVLISVLPEASIPLHKTLSAQFLGISYESSKGIRGGGDAPIPWDKILRNMPVLAILITHFCFNWGHYLVLAWMPTYFNKQLGVPEGNLGMTCVPYLTMSLGAGCWGYVADMLVASGWNLTATLTGLGMFCAALFFFLFGLARTSSGGLICISLGLFLATMTASGALINHVDVAPRLAGPVMGLTNTCATIPGMIAVPLSAYILQHTGSWTVVFGVASLVFVLGGCTFLRFGSAERQFE